MGISGDGSTLNLDFTGGSLDSRVVLTRSANTATYINSSGYVTTAVANEARFDYDPTTLAAKGLLIEGSAINLAYYSENLSNAMWTGDNSGATSPVVTSVSATNPAGGSTVNQVVLNKTGGSFSRLSQNAVAGTTSSTYTFSVWMRTVTGTKNVGLRLGSSTGIGCVVTTTWTRFTHTYTVGDTSASPQIMLWDNIPANDETATIYVWGAQVELGNDASSYIPTVASQVTRNPDLALMTSTNFSSWYTGGTTGTFFVDWYGGVRGIASTVRSVISTSDQTTKHLHMQQASAAGVLRVGDKTPTYVTTANSLTSGARTKGAFSFAYPGTGTTSTVNLSLNGGTVATSSAIAFSVAPTWLVLGGVSSTGTSLTDVDTVLNGSIRQIKYYPTALSNAQLQALTA
jgi:hypothetical protein